MTPISRSKPLSIENYFDLYLEVTEVTRSQTNEDFMEIERSGQTSLISSAQAAPAQAATTRGMAPVPHPRGRVERKNIFGNKFHAFGSSWAYMPNIGRETPGDKLC